MKDRYVYPAILTDDASGIAVEFPDLPGCYTCGPTLDEAFEMAREALGLHLFGLEQEGEAVPAPSRPADLMARLAQDQSVALVETWMPPIRGGAEERAVKKTLTLPKWLNDLAERQNVNFSHILQEGLKEYLGLASRLRSHSAGPEAREVVLREPRSKWPSSLPDASGS